MSAKEPKPLTGRKVLIGFVSFFAVIITVNGIMTFFAVDTFSGIETEDAYRKGRAFNEEIEKARVEKAIGWIIKVSESKAKSERVSDAPLPLHVVAITVTGAEGEPVEGLEITGTILRPVVKGMDQTVTFDYGAGGTYLAAADLPEDGKWQLKATVRDKNGNSRQIVEDLFFAP